MMSSLCGRAAGLTWSELRFRGEQFCGHRKRLKCVLICPDDLAGHLGVHDAPQSGSGSGSLHTLCFVDCDRQNSDVSPVMFVAASLSMLCFGL